VGYFSDGTRVRFELVVNEEKTCKTLAEKEFSYE